ncbi:MAG: Rrf2 family transcriptional regulator [Acidobacteria bacterium]|nr:Rrf2 family transcriptional regulator [Acidobacteriota bacterium]
MTSQHALRALSYLATQPRDSMLGGQELSRNTGVPKNYLSKILLVLGNAGIVEAVRGAAGGYRLARPPQKIPLIRVVELFDRHTGKRDCLLGLRQTCSDDDPCTAHHAWRPAKVAYFEFLESTTLLDISSEEKSRTVRSAGPAGRRSKRR